MRVDFYNPDTNYSPNPRKASLAPTVLMWLEHREGVVLSKLVGKEKHLWSVPPPKDDGTTKHVHFTSPEEVNDEIPVLLHTQCLICQGKRLYQVADALQGALTLCRERNSCAKSGSDTAEMESLDRKLEYKIWTAIVMCNGGHVVDDCH